MRKKQANLYFPDKKFKESQFLTKEELKDFQSEFTLFNRQISLYKLKQAMVNQNYHHTNKLVFNFIDKLSQQKKTIGFNDYIQQMNEDLNHLNKGQLISQMLDQQSKGQLSKQTLKQILQEELGRQILDKQMCEILTKLFDCNFQKNEKIPTQNLKKIVNNKLTGSK